MRGVAGANDERNGMQQGHRVIIHIIIAINITCGQPKRLDQPSINQHHPTQQQ